MKERLNKVFDTIWAYNYDLSRFEYDCKLYVLNNSLYWRNNDKFCRELSSREIDLINKYKEEIGQ